MISIIIPIKGHRIIERLLNYLRITEYPEPYEIIVVDAAPLTTSDIKKKFPHVRWLSFHSHNLESVAEQRNYGIKMSETLPL